MCACALPLLKSNEPMSAKSACAVSWLTIAALNAILFIAAGSNGAVIGQSASFGCLVNSMYLLLTSSSLMLGGLNWRKQQKVWAVLFWGNVVLVLLATSLHIIGLLTLPPALLIGLDLYWLNPYLFYTAKTSLNPDLL